MSDFDTRDRNPSDVLHTIDGVVRTHSIDKCHGRVCAVHNPTDHHMRDWPMLWRSDRALLERVCCHGIGHPDPDHLTYLRDMYGVDHAQCESIHGCCGCCRPL
jgi:hypothetical protein